MNINIRYKNYIKSKNHILNVFYTIKFSIDEEKFERISKHSSQTDKNV